MQYPTICVILDQLPLISLEDPLVSWSFTLINGSDQHFPAGVFRDRAGVLYDGRDIQLLIPHDPQDENSLKDMMKTWLTLRLTEGERVSLQGFWDLELWKEVSQNTPFDIWFQLALKCLVLAAESLHTMIQASPNTTFEDGVSAIIGVLGVSQDVQRQIKYTSSIDTEGVETTMPGTYPEAHGTTHTLPPLSIFNPSSAHSQPLEIVPETQPPGPTAGPVNPLYLAQDSPVSFYYVRNWESVISGLVYRRSFSGGWAQDGQEDWDSMIENNTGGDWDPSSVIVPSQVRVIATITF
ncbi:hypothetical protein FRC12_012326 [Ceratobasidium sp. 428]|nr:hypothetical protein FRC12_012326 [Ceratobasidium sp. 428]